MIFDIKRYAINDGPGIRTAVFFKGCPLECWWCHNPEGQSMNPQLMFRANRCKSSQACIAACPQGAISWAEESLTDWSKCNQCGDCTAVCYAGAREMVGRKVSAAELMTEILRDVPFYDQSGGGVTFTGGEPMFQVRFLEEMLLRCKQQGIHTAVDTAGFTSWRNFELVLPLVGLFLYDIKLLDDVRHQRYTSVSNRRILDNLKKLSLAGAHILIRMPLVPGINDDDENLAACASYLSGLPNLDGLALMPYHEIGLAKFQALGMQYKLDHVKPPSAKEVSDVEDYFFSCHLPVIRNSGGTNDQ